MNIGDYDSAEISDELSSRYGIVHAVGAHCAPLMHEVFGTKIYGAVRFVPHYNTEEEIDEAIRAVKELAENKKNRRGARCYGIARNGEKMKTREKNCDCFSYDNGCDGNGTAL